MNAVLRFAACLFLTFSIAAQAQGVEDVEWCLTGDADSRMDQQPARGYCPGFWVGGVMAAIYRPEVLSYIQGIQRDWADRAASMSCARNPQSDAIAVSLIAACQCHNVASANWVVGNPGPVLKRLRQAKSC